MPHQVWRTQQPGTYQVSCSFFKKTHTTNSKHTLSTLTRQMQNFTCRSKKKSENCLSVLKNITVLIGALICSSPPSLPPGRSPCIETIIWIAKSRFCRFAECCRSSQCELWSGWIQITNLQSSGSFYTLSQKESLGQYTCFGLLSQGKEKKQPWSE